eukprot:7259473-Prymnesium_polylepis.2
MPRPHVGLVLCSQTSGADPSAATGEGETAADLAKAHPQVAKILQEAMSAGSSQTGSRFPSLELV